MYPKPEYNLNFRFELNMSNMSNMSNIVKVKIKATSIQVSKGSAIIFDKPLVFEDYCDFSNIYLDNIKLGKMKDLDLIEEKFSSFENFNLVYGFYLYVKFY